MRYARIVDGSVAELREFGTAPDPNPKKGLIWLPCPVGTRPEYDQSTEAVDGPVYQVSEKGVTETYSKRAKTGQEISAEKDRAIASLNGGFGPLIKTLFNLHNRIRVLEGRPEHTMTQFKAALKDLL